MLQRPWPSEGATRVPYWVYQDEDLYREEQAKIWRGEPRNAACRCPSSPPKVAA